MAQVELPPWLKAADPAAEYARGAQIGASIAEASNSLQQRAQETATRNAMMKVRLDQQKQLTEEQHALQQQRLATSAAYDQQRVQLAQDRLKQAAALNQQKTKQAAAQFAARQTYQKGFEQIDASGMSEEEKAKAKNNLIMRLAPMMGTAGTEAGAMLRATRPNVPATIEDTGDFVKVTQPGGNVQLHAKPKVQDPNVKVFLGDRAATPVVSMPKSQALSTIPGLPDEARTNSMNQAVMQGASGKAAAPANSFSVAPPVAQRKAGETYMTPKGPHTWTGKGWTTYQPAEHTEAQDAGPNPE